MHLNGPMPNYRRRVAAGTLRSDPAQRRAVEKLQLLAIRLQDYDPVRPKRIGIEPSFWRKRKKRRKFCIYLFDHLPFIVELPEQRAVFFDQNGIQVVFLALAIHHHQGRRPSQFIDLFFAPF